MSPAALIFERISSRAVLLLEGGERKRLNQLLVAFGDDNSKNNSKNRFQSSNSLPLTIQE